MPNEFPLRLSKSLAEKLPQTTVATQLDAVVLKLNTICKRATLEFALSVGRLIIDNLYGGDLERWRVRGAKTASFRKLARHPQLPMSPVALYRSVAMYELCERIAISRWKNICTSHLRSVLPLASGDQERLLRLTEANAWSVRRLEEEVSTRKHHANAKSKGGRKSTSAAGRIIRSLDRSVDKLRDFVVTNRAEELSADDVHLVVQSIQKLDCVYATLRNDKGAKLAAANIDVFASEMPRPAHGDCIAGSSGEDLQSSSG
jgi:hypothetical protein